MINDKVKATRIVLARNPAYGMLAVNDDGVITNKLTGETYDGLDKAVDAIYASNISDFRNVGPGSTRLSRKTGAEALQSEVTAINNWMLKSGSKARLQKMGLGRLVGKEINGTFLLYNWQGKKDTLDSILNPNNLYRSRFPGFTNITDEGVQVFSYGIAGDDVPLSALEQSLLKTAAGVQSFRPDFVQDFLKGVANNDAVLLGKSLSKLPKRVQSQLAPRTVSFGSDAIQSLVKSMGSGGGIGEAYDLSELLLRTAAGERVTGLNALLLRKTGGIQRGGVGGLLGAEEALERIARASGIIGGTPYRTVDDPDNLLAGLRQQLKLAYQDVLNDPNKGKANALTMVEALERRSKNINIKQYQELIGRLNDSIETFRDGSYWLTDIGYKKLLDGKITEYKNLKALYESQGNITQEMMLELKGMKDEIDDIQYQIDNHSRVQDPTRIGTAAGTFKGDSGIKTFEDLFSKAEYDALQSRKNKLLSKGRRTAKEQKELDEIESFFTDIYDPAKRQFGKQLVIAPTSALKKEMGSEAAQYIAVNVATKHSPDVYLEPMQLMVDPTSFTDPTFLARQQAVMGRVSSDIEKFRKTGYLPEEFISILRKEAVEYGVDPSDVSTYGKIFGVSLEAMDPTQRGLAMIKRKEIEEIFNALQANRDPRQIPAIVSRLNTFFATEVYALKNDVPRLKLFDATRFRIRTYGSELASAPGVTREGKDFFPVRVGKEIKDATFVQFSVRGDAMVIADENARLYKAALGTFDLDDKGIPILRTFTDAKGRTRTAFVVVRDPKSIEESFYARLNLQDAESLYSILNKDSEMLSGLGESFDEFIFKDRLMQETNLDEKTLKKVYNRVKKIGNIKDIESFKGSSFIQFKGPEQIYAVETIMRLAKEAMSGPLQTLDSTPEFFAAIEKGSASTRGSDALIDIGGRTITEQRARNLSSEQGSKYFNKAFVELQREKDMANATVAGDFVDMVNQELGFRRKLTAQEIFDVYSGKSIAGVDDLRLKGVVNFSLEKLLQISSRQGVPDVENTIGMLANRMSAVYSMSAQMNENLSDKAADFLNKKFAIGTIAASDMVDLVKQLIGDKSLKTFAEASQGLDDYEKEQLKSVYQSIARRVSARTGKNVTFDNLGRYELTDIATAAMEQQFERLGYQRALQIAQGVSADELVGLDPMLAERLGGPEGMKIAQQAVVRGMEDALQTSQQAGVSLNAAKRNAITQAINNISSLHEAKAIEAISLIEGTDAFNKYAATSVTSRLAAQHRADLEIATRGMQKIAASKITAKADLRVAAEAMLKSSGVVELFNDFEQAQRLIAPLNLEEQVARQRISFRLAEGLEAIRANYAGGTGDVLDIVDAIELEVRNKFGNRATRFLGGLGAEGVEDAMMGFFQLARNRRAAQADLSHVGAFNFIQDLFREHVGNKAVDLAEVDADYARQFLEYQRSLPVGSPEAMRSSDLAEYMMRVAGEQVQFTNSQANNAMTYNMATKTLESLKSDTNAVAQYVASMGVGAEDIDGKMTDDIIRSLQQEDDELFEVARSPYKRIGQSIREGALGDLVKSKTVRMSAIATGALILGSFIYQGNKERTASDIQGPPLLPGGNPYEAGYPSMQPRINQLQQSQTAPSGVQYRINTSGSVQDLNRLRGMFGDVIDGPIDSTMYDGLPILGRDPYSDVASRF